MRHLLHAWLGPWWTPTLGLKHMGYLLRLVGQGRVVPVPLPASTLSSRWHLRWAQGEPPRLPLMVRVSQPGLRGCGLGTQTTGKPGQPTTCSWGQGLSLHLFIT